MPPETSELLKRLETSAFRSKFHLNAKDVAYLTQKGFSEIAEHADRFIAQRLAPATPVRDGKQTPYRGHPVFVAQHATATCCRTCLMKWHQIPKGIELSAEQQTYVVSVIINWLRTESKISYE
jgi:Domain of unknown function (DUF4186)